MPENENTVVRELDTPRLSKWLIVHVCNFYAGNLYEPVSHGYVALGERVDSGVRDEIRKEMSEL